MLIANTRLFIDEIQWKSPDELVVKLQFIQSGESNRSGLFDERIVFVVQSEDGSSVAFGQKRGGRAGYYLNYFSTGQQSFHFDDIDFSIRDLNKIQFFVVEHTLIGSDVREVEYTTPMKD